MGFILIFDVTNSQSFLDVGNWMTQLKTHSGTVNPKAILCGNKSDLEEARSVTYKVAKKLSEE